MLRGRMEESRVGQRDKCRKRMKLRSRIAFLSPQPSEGSPARLPSISVEQALNPAFTEHAQMLLFAEINSIL